MTLAHSRFGEQLRGWRQLRRMSQMDLALDAEISTRHLSFVETGRSQPSRDVVVRLAERLDVPLRARNSLLVAAGLAPAYAELELGDPMLAPARRAIDLILKAHEPFPAIAVDRHWNMAAANRAIAPFLEGASQALLAPPVNVLRLSLHPDGLASRIVNLAEWKSHILDRLREQCIATGDAGLEQLKAELVAYPAPAGTPGRDDFAGLLVPMRIRAGGTELSFFSTTTVFGTPTEVTLSELAIETFLPADSHTGDLLRSLAEPKADA